jgi:GWxTD domain-containing protein
MHRLLLVLAIIASASASAVCTAQGSLAGKGPFRIDMDLARFAAEGAQTYLEVYYGIPEQSLAFREDSGKYRGGVRMMLEIRSESSSVATREWAVPHTLADTAGLRRAQSLMGMVSLALPRGEYRLILTASDLEAPGRRDSLSTPLSVKGFEEERADLSDVELCSSIRQSDNKESIFYKNTLEVIPNASRMYGAGLPILQYYVEVYNLAKSDGSTPAIARISVINSAGREVKTHARPKSRQHNSTVEVGTVNLSGLPGGSYRLRVALLDTAATPERLLATSEKKFFVYRVPGAGGDSLANAQLEAPSGGEYSFQTEEEVHRAYDEAQYIATQMEERQYEQMPDLKGRQNFMADFWRRRDPDPSTAVNEFKTAYYERIAYANARLSNRFNDGWKSDRGRVYIIYGPYDEIDRAPSTAESLPYEIWQYNNVQGGVIFVFVDRNNFGDYLLVHSTHRNELHNENWLEEHARRTN